MAENPRNLVENVDYEIDARGGLVFTAAYLLRRGHCCGSGCRHCPYDYANVPEPRRAALQATRRAASANPTPGYPDPTPGHR